MGHKPSKATMNPKRLEEGTVRITDLNTGKSKNKAKRRLDLRGAMQESTQASIDRRNARLNKAIDGPTGHRKRMQ